MQGNHLPIALHVKYQCVGVYPSFNFRVNCPALENALILTRCVTRTVDIYVSMSGPSYLFWPVFQIAGGHVTSSVVT